MESDKNQFWVSKVWCLSHEAAFELVKLLNDFYKDKFVIATQMFAPSEQISKWVAFVYYKEKPSMQPQEAQPKPKFVPRQPFNRKEKGNYY